MKNQRHLAGLALTVVTLCCTGRAQAQEKCPAPPALASAQGANIFAAQRETELGELMAEQMDSRYQVIEDTELTAFMDRIAGRLLTRLPETGLRFRIFLIDAPVADAFSTPGGRIYVSRKMVAFLRNEDEMAGLLGHEIGHIVSHQPAIEMTMLFQQVLGVHEVTSREDIAKKYNQLLDNESRGTPTFRKMAREEEPDQYVADQVSLFTVANAGYSPQAVLDLFDRLAQTHGKTGGFFSNWFGLTTPAEKRLREMQKMFASLPPACAKTATVSTTSEFQKWQSDVVGYSRLDRRESLPALVAKEHLNPPLRGDFTYLRFSSNGQYALAQDESSIYVLTRLPFAFLFRIDAPDALFASFTPDSTGIVFSTSGLRVENWNIANQKRVSVHELTIQEECVQSLLSPDGQTLACLIERDGAVNGIPIPYLDLRILDIASGEAVFTRKQFVAQNFENAFFLMFKRLAEPTESDLYPIAFSPDARYFVAASESTTLTVDLKTRNPITLRGPLNDILKGGFAFLGPERVIAQNRSNPAKSAVLAFPSGELIAAVSLGNQSLSASAQGNYALLRPVSNALVGVMDLKTNKGVLALRKTPAIDVFDQQFIAQGETGEVGLFDLKTTNVEAKTELPIGPLRGLRAKAVSSDLRYLAVSGNTRGAIWDLSHMKEIYSVRGFHGAFFDGDTGFYADFPKDQQTGRAIARADLSAMIMDRAVPLDADSNVRQYGPYLVARKPNRKDKSLIRDITLEVADARDGKTLWTMNFPKDLPEVFVIPDENRVVLEWNAEAESAKEEIKKRGDLSKQFSAVKDHFGVFLMQVLEAGTGRPLGAVFVDTGKYSFFIRDAYAAGDWLLVTDNENRALAYSIANGEMNGSVFGGRPVLSPTAGLVGIENDRGQLQIYSLPTLEKRSHISFSSPIAMDRFSADGKRLFVLTNDQNFYVFDSTALARPNPSDANAPD